MKTDRELLELAARAAGIPYIVPAEGYNGHLGLMAGSENPMHCSTWSPLTDDGDALRLAVKLGIIVDSSDYPSIDVQYKHSGKYWILTEDSGDADVSARRAIVRAAAEIGEGMK